MYGSVAAYWAARDGGVQGASGVEGEALSGIEHQSSLPLGNSGSLALNAVSPFVGWAPTRPSGPKRRLFKAHGVAKSAEYADSTMTNFAEAGVHGFGVRFNGAADTDAHRDVILLNGCITPHLDLAWPSVVVVGTSKPRTIN